MLSLLLFTGRRDEAYIVTAFGSRSLERFDPRSGRREVLAGADDGLDSPTCIVWEPGSRHRALVLANAGFPFATTDPRPRILRVVL